MKTTLTFLSFILISIGFLNAQETTDRISAHVTENAVKGHLSFLTSDALKGRNTGEQGLEAAAAYISAEFIKNGVKPVEEYPNFLQNVGLVKLTPPATSSIDVNETSLSYPNDFFLLSGDEREMSSQTVFLNHGLQSDYEDVDVRLKVVVAICGDGENTSVQYWMDLAKKKREWAREAGAIALIEIYKNGTYPWRLLSNYMKQAKFTLSEGYENSGDFSHMWLSANEELLAEITESSLPISFDLKAVEMEMVESDNVVGYLPGSDPALKDEYIVFTAHYDHVGQGRPDASGDDIYNGARDNGVGTTAVLMLAEYLKAYPLKRSALFVLFTGEEKGLLGSRYFVDHSPVDLSDIKYCMNIDNAGYNDTTIISVIGLTRTEAEEDFIAAAEAFGLGAIEDAAKEQGLFDRSDNVNFARKGIPAPTFSLGFRGFDAEIMKYYHQPGDDLESLNLDYILKYVKAYLMASELIGNADKVPFWNEGDKYYPAGKELYMAAPEKEGTDH